MIVVVNVIDLLLLLFVLREGLKQLRSDQATQCLLQINKTYTNLWIQLPCRAVSAGSSCYFLSGSILYSLLAIGMKRGKILT